MIRYAAAAMALLAGASQDSAAQEQLRVAQVIVRQQIVIRVPRGRERVPAVSPAMNWREAEGPRCVAARDIAAARPSQSSVDLIMRDNRRFRAQLGQRCTGLNYYRGIYVAANPDGRICAQRDVIRSRMGGACGITAFRSLQPTRR